MNRLEHIKKLKNEIRDTLGWLRDANAQLIEYQGVPYNIIDLAKKQLENALKIDTEG